MSWKRWILAATIIAAPAAVWAATRSTPAASADCPCKPGDPCPLEGGKPCAAKAAMAPAAAPCPCAGGGNATASHT